MDRGDGSGRSAHFASFSTTQSVRTVTVLAAPVATEPHGAHVERTPRQRLALTAAVVGAAAIIAIPQWVAAGSGAPAGGTDSAAATTTTLAPPPPTDAGSTPTAPAAVATTTTAAPPLAAAAPTAPAPAPSPVPAPHVADGPASGPVEALEAPSVEASVEAPVPDASGALTVHVAPVEGATRLVTLRRADGTPVAGSLTVTDGPVKIGDLGAGGYELLVEHFANGGGAFVTRTPITIAAGADVHATCHTESLDCAVR